MRSLFICAVLFVQALQIASASAQEESVLARAYVNPEGEVYAGQLFALYIQVQTDTGFSSSPFFPDVALENATAVRPEQLGISFSERVNRKTYVGIRQRFLVSAQRAGALVIPAFTFEFSVASSEDTNIDVPMTVITEALIVDVVMPPGLESIHNVAVTPSLTLTERFDPPLVDLQVGDAFLRSVTLSANNAMGFLLPATLFSDAEGLAVYSSSPRFEDNNVRGRATGTRIDSASYILQAEGEYQLTPISVQWFDLERGELRTLETEPQSLIVAANLDLPDVLVTGNNDEQPSRLLEGILNVVNWVLAHVKALCFTALLIVGARYCWYKYSASILLSLARVYRKVTGSELWFTVKLFLTCLFLSKDSIRKYLSLWVQRGENAKFKESKTWVDLSARYRVEESRVTFSRVVLLLELLKYVLSKKEGKSGDGWNRLNP